MPHSRAMDIDRFWQLIDQARDAAGPRRTRRSATLTCATTTPTGTTGTSTTTTCAGLVEASRAEFGVRTSPTRAGEERRGRRGGGRGRRGRGRHHRPGRAGSARAADQLPAAEIAGVRQRLRGRPGRGRRAGRWPTPPCSSSTASWATTASTTSGPGWWRWAGPRSRRPPADPDSLADHPLVREIAAPRTRAGSAGRTCCSWPATPTPTVTGEHGDHLLRVRRGAARRRGRRRRAGRGRRPTTNGRSPTRRRPGAACPGCPSCSTSGRCATGKRAHGEAAACGAERGRVGR